MLSIGLIVMCSLKILLLKKTCKLASWKQWTVVSCFKLFNSKILEREIIGLLQQPWVHNKHMLVTNIYVKGKVTFTLKNKQIFTKALKKLDDDFFFAVFSEL